MKKKKTNIGECKLVKTEQTPLPKKKTRKLEYFGHRERERQNSRLKMAYDRKIEGKRPPGRPRNIWIEKHQEMDKPGT